MDTITYPYKPKLWLMLLVLVFFGGLTAVMVNEAMTNQRGLVLNGILNFDTNGATVFYWVLGAVSLTFVGLGLWALG